MSGNIIELAFGSEISATSEELVYRFDYGQKIHFTDLELPEYFEVHFSNSRQGKATKQIGHNNVVDIPDAYLEKGSVYGWIFLHSTESDGETEYEFKIPVKNRATPSDGEVTPEQESVISQAIAALTETEAEVQSLHDETLGYKNDASSSASAASGYADNSAASATASSGYADNASASALSASGYADSASGYADAAEGYAESASGYADDAEAAKDAVLGMSATATTLSAGSSATASYEDGVLTLGIPRGADGQDGQDGQDGRDGADGQNGQDGADGSGIESVVKTSTSGLVDTYTITFDDGRTTTFDITNGEDGNDGATGATPDISIGTVETLEPNESATASMSGTAENPVLNLGIPQGRQGEVTLSQLEQILPTDTASGSIASFSDGCSLFSAKSVVIGIEPKQSGSGTPSPDNVRPISGWTGAEVTVFPSTWEQGAVSYYSEAGHTWEGSKASSTIRARTASLIDFPSGTTQLTISMDFANYEGIARPFDKEGHNVVLTTADGFDNTWHTSAWTIKNADKFAIMIRKKNNGDITASDAQNAHVQLSPNYGETYPISWQTEAGTVYGGEVEIVSGSGKDGYKKEGIPSYTYFYSGSYTVALGFYLSKASTAVANNQKHGAVSNMKGEDNAYYGSNRTNDADSVDVGFAISNAGTFCVIYDADTTLDKNGMLAKYADFEVCYPLATPITYNLTPTDIALLQGTNNVWSDTGDTEVTYKADIQWYIDKKINALI